MKDTTEALRTSWLGDALKDGAIVGDDKDIGRLKEGGLWSPQYNWADYDDGYVLCRGPRTCMGHAIAWLFDVESAARGTYRIDGALIAQTFLHLTGATGTGKTWVANTLAVYWAVKKHVLARRVSWLDWLLDTKSKANGEQALAISKLRATPFLVLDEIGNAARWTRFAAEQFLGIIGYRGDRLLPTVFTSNQTLVQLADLFGESALGRDSKAEMADMGAKIARRMSTEGNVRAQIIFERSS